VRITEEEQPVVEELYRRYCERRTGSHVRSDRWWKEAFFRRIYDTDRKISDVAVWHSEDGEAGGYACYQSARDPGPAGTSKLWVREFVALSGDAYQGLLRYILSHDLADEIMWYGPVEDPLAYAVDDSLPLKREYVDDLMLRVVDIEKAVAARPRQQRPEERSHRDRGCGRTVEPGTCADRVIRRTRGAARTEAQQTSRWRGDFRGGVRWLHESVGRCAIRGWPRRRAARRLRPTASCPEYPPNGSDFFPNRWDRDLLLTTNPNHPVNEADRDRLKTTFNEAAELYDRARHTIRSSSSDDLIDLTGLQPGASLLEIGCGTGRATLPLARRGFRITCVRARREPRRRRPPQPRRLPQVNVVTSPFETWDLTWLKAPAMSLLPALWLKAPAAGLPLHSALRPRWRRRARDWIDLTFAMEGPPAC
jgi:hypothetical protein